MVKPTQIQLYSVMLLLFVIACMDSSHQNTHIESYGIEHGQAVNQINNLLADQNHDEALEQINTLLSSLTDEHKDLKAWLYHKQAYIYEQRHHYHFAITTLNKANLLLPDKQGFTNEISKLQSIIDNQQPERNQRTHYEDGRDSGIAKRLSQDVTIAYIYLDDNQWSKWSLKSRVQNQHNIDHVKNWYLMQAHSYTINDLNIDVRYFYVKSPKGISKEWLRSKAFFNQASPIVSRQLGYIDFREFVEDMSNNDPNHQVAIVFHSNNQARSFARSCKKTAKNNHCFFEYVMLTEQINHPLYSWAMPQVQAHEILHLFGAGDLYNINGAKDFAVTDLMNYYSDSIQHATIEPITAWAIGWHKLPDTPFPINLIKDP